MIPALARRMPRHRAVDDLDLASCDGAGTVVPQFLKDRFEPILGVDTPAGADRVADQGHAEGSARLLERILAVAHSLVNWCASRGRIASWRRSS